MVNQKAYQWHRPMLPEQHQGSGLGWGLALLVFGIAFTWWGLSEPDLGAVLLLAGSGLGSTGILLLVVCSILREIRRMAFEAALRAGEVQTIDKPVLFPNAKR